MRLALAELARLVGGRLAGGADPGAPARDLVIDSRQVAPGSVFAAIVGERVDGHDFAREAVAAGAVAVLAARPVGVPSVLVADVTEALGALAHQLVAARRELTVVGMTGSSGKTTVKDMTAAVLGAVGPTVAPPGSYNTEIGLPLTACRVEPETRFLVLEYSARRVGHIARLTRLVRPHAAAVLNVGQAHLGEFGSREAIGVAKGELVAALDAGGTAVLNADDPVVAGMAARTAARVLTFGFGDADVRARRVRLDELARPAFQLLLPGAEPADLQLGFSGRHQVPNALAAAALAHAVGVPAPTIVAALTAARPASRWRMELSELPGGVLVVNDAYNANPDSVRAALQALADLAGGRRRCWLVLGEMAELGSAGPAAHAEVGRQAAEFGVSRLVAVGNAAQPAAESARAAGVDSCLVADAAAAASALRGRLRAGDVVLVKGSRAAGLESVAEALGAPGADR